MRMLKKVVLCVAFIVVVAAIARGGERSILRIYCWSEYFSEAVLADFEDKYKCLVAIDNFDSNEAMLENVRAGGNYDLITPSSYMMAEMRDLRMLRRLDRSLLPNLAHIDPQHLRLTEDPGMEFSVPYTRTVTGVGYNRETLGAVEPSWRIFNDARVAGRATMLADMRECLGAALKASGYSINSTNEDEIVRAGELLLEWKGNLARLEVDEGNIGLGSGDFLAVQAYNGDVMVLMEENEGINFFVPDEGSSISSDDFVIPAASANAELAHAFVNHLLDPENAARNMEDILYYMPVPQAVSRLPERIRDHPAFAVSGETLERCEVIRSVGGAMALYERVWREVAGDED